MNTNSIKTTHTNELTEEFFKECAEKGIRYIFVESEEYYYQAITKRKEAAKTYKFTDCEILGYSKLDNFNFDLMKNKKIYLHVNGNGYESCYVADGHTKKLHHFLHGKPPEGFVTNHIDMDSFNNTIENLEFVTKRKNSIHTNKHSSPYFGVSAHGDKWEAYYVLKNIKYHISLFNIEDEAGVVVDKFREIIGDIDDTMNNVDHLVDDIRLMELMVIAENKAIHHGFIKETKKEHINEK